MYLSDVIRLEQEYMESTYRRSPVDIVRGEKSTCFDGEGRSYLDFASGGGVNSLGYAHPDWVREVTQQVECLAHGSNHVYTRPQVQLAKILCERTNQKKAVFSSSGSEAVALMVQAARQWDRKRNQVILLEGSYHGHALRRQIKRNALREQDDFVFVKQNDIRDLTEKITPKTVAILLECIQSEYGVFPLSEEFAKTVKILAEEHGLLILVDEITTGIGRTGRFLCSSYYSITPDAVVLSGGLAGGLPLAATLFGSQLAGVLQPGDYKSTFAGNPVAAVGAKAVLQAVNGKLLDQVAAKGRYLAEEAGKFPGVVAIHGKGLLVGLVLEDDFFSEEIVDQAVPKGLLLLPAGNQIVLLPPLTITYDELDLGLERLEEVLTDYAAYVEQRKEEEK